MSRRIHFVYEERACGCGDSFCSEDYEYVKSFACKRGAEAPSRFLTRNIAEVTCETCAKSPACRKAFDESLRAARAESVVTIRKERDRFREALEQIKRGASTPREVAAKALADV